MSTPGSTHTSQEAARRLWQRVAGRTSRADRVFTKDIFRVQFAGTLNDKHDLTDMDIDVLLTYLMRDKQMIAYDGQVKNVSLGPLTTC